MSSRSGGRVAQLVVPDLLGSVDFQAALAELTGTLGMDPLQAREEARASLEELAIQPRDRYLHWSARLARFMYSRSYDAQLDVNTVELQRLRALARERPLVFLWSHKSHLDSFVFMRAIYDNDFVPQPLSFAGINMDFAGFGGLARRSGAIFLRRSFAGADIYKLVFKYYIRWLVKQRVPLSWSIEGTRSRTGKLMPPKPGLLQWVLEALDEVGCDNALLVPVSISFDQIAEIEDYIAINRGQPKRRESLAWFLGFIFGMRRPVGRIHVRFAEPVNLSDRAGVTPAMVGHQASPQQALTRQLALEISRRIEHATLVTPASLVSLALLAAPQPGLPGTQLRQWLQLLLQQVTGDGLPRDPDLETRLGHDLANSLAQLQGTGLLEASGSGGWRIAGGRELGASYYRNTISHYFLSPAMAELALAGLMGQPHADIRESLQQSLTGYRDLLKFEFVFKSTEAVCDEAIAYLDLRFAGWETALAQESSPFGGTAPLYGCGVLRSFIEAYHVVVTSLMESGPDAAAARDGGKRFMDCGGELLRQGRIMSATALSLPLFENALRLIRHRKLLHDSAGRGSDLGELADQLAHAMQALQLLQSRIDDSLQDPAVSPAG